MSFRAKKWFILPLSRLRQLSSWVLFSDLLSVVCELPVQLEPSRQPVDIIFLQYYD
jgi:hypothetical protein